MRVWLSLPFVPIGQLPELVTGAEELGVEGVTVSDHVCVPAAIDSTYPYTGRTALLPTGTEFPDPLTLVASLAAVTSRIRLMTHVLVIALRNPIVLAKEIATVAQVAAGRFDLGIGVGWLREEFEAVGVPFERRGAITDESLDIMRGLWTGRTLGHQGDAFSFAPIASWPVPATPVPVLAGGYRAPAIRRAAALDGWLGVTPPIEELAHLIGAIRQERARIHRADDPFVIRTGVKGTLTTELMTATARLGVDALIVTPHQLGDPTTAGKAPEAGPLLDRLAGIVAAAGAVGEPS